MRRAILAAGLAAAILVPPLRAQEPEVLIPDPKTPTTRVGTRGANFLSIPVGARARAMGDAATALDLGVHALYWNTAAITELEGFSAAFSYMPLYEDLDISQNFLGVVLPTRSLTLGVSVISLSSGDITRTTINYPEGGDPQFGEVFEWTSLAVGLHGAKRITDRLSVGGAAKFISEGIDNATAQYIAADVGLLFRTGLYGTTIGAALRNAGSKGEIGGPGVKENIPDGQDVFPVRRILPISFTTQDNSLPTDFHFSVATDLIGGPEALITPNPAHQLVAVADFSDPTDAGIQTAVGVEYSLNRMLFLRAGKRWVNEAQISHDVSYRTAFGGGVSLPLGERRRVLLDYAYTDYGDLENVQVFSIEFHF